MDWTTAFDIAQTLRRTAVEVCKVVPGANNTRLEDLQGLREVASDLGFNLSDVIRAEGMVDGSDAAHVACQEDVEMVRGQTEGAWQFIDGLISMDVELLLMNDADLAAQEAAATE
jgi:hypothetical protein